MFFYSPGASIHHEFIIIIFFKCFVNSNSFFPLAPAWTSFPRMPCVGKLPESSLSPWRNSSATQLLLSFDFFFLSSSGSVRRATLSLTTPCWNISRLRRSKPRTVRPASAAAATSSASLCERTAKASRRRSSWPQNPGESSEQEKRVGN